MTDRPTPKTCEKDGHIRGHGDKCVFCKTALPRTDRPTPDDISWELQGKHRLSAEARCDISRVIVAERAEAHRFRRKVRDELLELPSYWRDILIHRLGLGHD